MGFSSLSGPSGAGGMSDDMDDPTGGEGIVAEINVTPLVDVFLLLLIIFMVTSSVISQSSIPVQLPKSNQVATAAADAPGVVVTVDSAAAIFVNGVAVPRDRLGDALKLALGRSKNKTVVLEGDRKAVLGTVVEIMDEGKKAGAEKFAVATKSDN